MANPEEYFTRIVPLAKGAPDPLIHMALIDAAREFCSETLFVNRAVAPITTIENTQTYPISVTQEEEIIGIVSAEGMDSNVPPNIWPLTPSNPSGWNAFISPGPPANFFFVPYSSVALFPIPDTTYTINLVVAVQPRQGATVLPDEAMRRYDREICDGALAYLLRMPKTEDTPWGDPMAAMGYAQSLVSAISRARSEMIRSNRIGGYIAKRRPFIV